MTICAFWTSISPPFLSGVGARRIVLEPPTIGIGSPLSLIAELDSHTPASCVPMLAMQSPVASIRPKWTTLSQSRTRNVRVAGERSTLPSRALARTWGVCWPPASLAARHVSAHSLHALVSTFSLVVLSKRHSYVELASLDANFTHGAGS